MKKYLVPAFMACLFFASAPSQSSAPSPTNSLSDTTGFSQMGVSSQTNVPSPTNGSSRTAPSSRPAWKFRSVEYAGMLFGQAGNYGQLQTVNGVYRGSWFLGAGGGLDFYRFRSAPVFLAVTKDLMPTKNGFFVSLDAGANFPWYKRPEGYYDGFSTSKFRAGPFWAAGLGYKIRLPGTGNQALSLLGGYSYKQLKEDADTSPGPTRYKYGNKTWSLKIGLTL